MGALSNNLSPGKLLGLCDFRGLEGSKITIFLSILTGFEAHGKNFCDILVQLTGFEDRFGEILHLKGMSGPKIFGARIVTHF